MTNLDRILARIARDHLGIETLESRGLDRLDFHEVSVRGVKDALTSAFLAGIEDCVKENDEETTT